MFDSRRRLNGRDQRYSNDGDAIAAGRGCVFRASTAGAESKCRADGECADVPKPAFWANGFTIPDAW